MVLRKGVLPLIFHFCSIAVIHGQYYGREIGSFNMSDEVTGELYAVDNFLIFVRNFTFDGNAFGADARFYAGIATESTVSEVFLPDERGQNTRLGTYINQDLFLSLPERYPLDSFLWIAVWDVTLQVPYDNVTIPSNFTPPEPYVLGPLGMDPPVYNVTASSVIIQNIRQITFENLYYDGTAPAAYFWTGERTPDSNGRRVPDQNGEINRPLPAFHGVTLTITLPDDLTVFDIDYIGIWCERARQDFGHVIIDDEHRSNLPPYIPTALPQLVRNCVVLEDNVYQVSWQLDEPNNKITLDLSGRVALNEYMAFGISGSDTRTLMVGSDVTVVWIDPSTNEAQADDYYLSAYSQCVVNGAFGACPDTFTEGSTNDAVLQGATVRDDIVTITVERPLITDDPLDTPIPTDRPVYISWSLGFINALGLVSRHHTRTNNPDNLQINFGSQGSVCPEFTPLDDGEDLEPWIIDPLITDGNDSFVAMIGPAGRQRGYQGITGQIGWGIAWYINGSLIPEITVQRGYTYRFEVYGGNDNTSLARYHPFYITSSPDGGYSQSSPSEQQRETIYAGPVEGTLCQYQSRFGVNADTFPDFEDFVSTLSLDCPVDAEPGILEWEVAEDTPDVVYYQCYTHRYLGWRINVEDGFLPTQVPDPCSTDPCANGGICQALGTTGFFCTCVDGFTGIFCEDVVPDFICPIDQTVTTELGSGDDVAVSYEDPVITIPGVQFIGCTPESGGTFPVGANEANCIAYQLDTFEFLFCSFFVTVVVVDTTPPTISDCPSDQEVETDFISLNAAVEWTVPTASDLSDSAELVSFPSQSPGDVFSIGQTELTYVFEDPSGNRAQCNFTVSVIPVGPLPESVIDACPVDITTTVELGTPSATVTWTEPIPTGIPVRVMLSSRSHSPGSFFPVGETTVLYLFEYGQSSTLSCLFVVTVETVDTTAPTISGCPIDQEVETDFISLNAAVEWTVPTASDLSDSAELVSFPSQSPGDVFSIGQTELTYVFEDPSGNRAQCNFTVSVIPVGPLPESVIDACPGDITTTVELGTGSSATVTWTEPVPTGIPVNVTQASRSHPPGSSFSVGETTVSYRFQYDQSSTIDCMFVVTVETVDTTPPVISGCPENQTEIIPFQAQVGQVTWPEPSATDQSGVPMLSSRTHEPGSSFSIGSTKVEYIFTDDSANQANCIFFVLVEEAPPNAPPNITCPFLESVPEGEVEPTCVDRETAARDLVATCEVSPVSPVLVILNCFCSDGDGGQASCQLEIPVIPTSLSTSTLTTTPLTVASTTPSENSTDPVLTDVSSQSMMVTVPMPACPRLSIDNTEVVCIGPDLEDCYITCKAGTLNAIPSRELFSCVVTETGARWSPRPLNVCQSPSLPLHVTGLMMIPLETNATNCSDLSNSMDSISNYFATIARSNFALFCDTAEVPFCGDSLQGVETTQECYQPPGSSARRRRQADQEVMINVTLQVRANMTKEEIVRFLEQTRMDLATGGTRQIPLTGGYSAELTDASAERIFIDEDQFIFTCNPGYANLKESGCVLCPAGTSEVNGRCQYCSRGSFQDRPGQTTCVKCTQKEGVLPGSDTRADCKSIPEKEAQELNVLLIAFIILAGIFALLVLGLLVVLCITICCCREEETSKHESAGNFLDMRIDGDGSQEFTAENHAFEESDENDSAIGSVKKQDHDGKETFVAIEDESVDPEFEMQNPTYDSAPTISQVGMFEEEMSAL